MTFPLKYFQTDLLLDGLCFALAKGAAFLVPLLAVRLLTLNDFGILETSFGWAQQLAAFLGLGFSGAYPFFILKKQKTAMQFHFLAYAAGLSFLAILVFALFLFGILPTQASCILIITFLFAQERIFGSMLKAHDVGRFAVLAESLYYFGLGAALLLLFGGIVPPDGFLAGLILMLLLLTLSLGSWSGLLLKKRLRHFRERISLLQLKNLLGYSLPLVLSGIIIFWLVTCPRIYLSMLLGNEAVGRYAFCFRFLAVAMLVHQFSYIMFFRKLYIVGTKRLDRNFTLLLGIVSVSALLCLAAFSFCRGFFPSVQYDKIFLVALELACFMPLWCGITLAEGIISRENQVNRMNLFLLPQFLLFPLVVFALRSRISLESFCTLHLISCLLVFLTQTAILAKRDVALVKSSFLVVGIAAFGVIAFLCLR